MKSASPLLRHATAYCVDCLALMACWSAWIALGALLVVQIVIATSHEFALPGWMLRSIEGRFAASGVQAQFGRATFDPTGGVLLENLSLTLPAYEQPVLRARAVYLDLDPWLLLSGQVEPHRAHATGIQIYVPGMLSPSGHDEEIIRDLELTLIPGEDFYTIEHLSARVAGVALTAHGAVQLPRRTATSGAQPLPLLANLSTHFAAVCQQVLRAQQQLAHLDDPQLDLVLVPSPTRVAIAELTGSARQLSLPQFHELAATGLRATARFPLLGDSPAMSPVILSADTVSLGERLTTRGFSVSLRGALNPATPAFTPAQAEVSIGELTAQGFHLTALAARLTPRPWPQLDADLVTFLESVPLGANLQADITAQTATAHLVGGAAPALLTPIGAAIGHDIRRFFDYGAPIDLDLVARFDPGWKFHDVAGHVALREVDAYRVPIDTALGEITFDGRHFVARHAMATIGENFARGSFEQDLVTKDYRFLLEGRLRPLDIGGWFHGAWWQNIFAHFEFPEVPPDANVDVSGRWFVPGSTGVFVYADSRHPVINTAPLDHVRTRLWIRPHFLDGLEVFATRGDGTTRSRFTYHFSPENHRWVRFSVDGDSSLDLDTATKLLGSTLATHLTPFTFHPAPQVHVVGDFTGPGAADGVHQRLRVAARSTGDFTFYRFPGQKLAFDADLQDDTLTVTNVRAQVFGGTLTGTGRVAGTDSARRLSVDGKLAGASLPRAVSTITEYAAVRQRRVANSSEKFLSGQTDTTLDLALQAEGRLDDPYSFDGAGTAALAGELGQVRLLGLLSELLNFTSLRFTGARADFKLQGHKVVFPSVSITGANSAIVAHGDYTLDRHELNFNARVYPFQESKSLLSVVGFVLTPFSAVLEVKLTGPLDQPKWAFVIGPTNLLRSLGSSPSPATPTPTPPSTAAPAPATETH